jgi:hypothetical protein
MGGLAPGERGRPEETIVTELPGGFDNTGARFGGWAKSAGIVRTEEVPLAGPTSAAIAYKD